jgi:dihydrodipicolinate synthase/N-acetylneuraminate lyase
MVTPLRSRDRLDVPGLERIVERLVCGGVHGLFILGSTGEGPSLPPAMRREIITRVCEQAAGSVPVLVGISDTCLSESLRWAEIANDAGASGLVLAPPYYLPASQLELIEYVERMAPELPLPVLLYNAPSFTKLSFAPKTVCTLAAVPNVVGLKDSSGDRIYFHNVKYLLRDYPDFAMLVGPEELLADLLLWGGHGGVSGGAHLWPRLYVDLYDAAVARDFDRLTRLHGLVMYVNTRIYGASTAPSSVFKALKCGLSLMGICEETMAYPLQPFTARERETVRDCMSELSALLDAEQTLRV